MNSLKLPITNLKPFGTTMREISLFHCVNDETHRWGRGDGKWVSPIFSSVEAAHHYGHNAPLLTDEEWAEYYPLPKDHDVSQIPKIDVL